MILIKTLSSYPDSRFQDERPDEFKAIEDYVFQVTSPSLTAAAGSLTLR